MEGIHPPTIDSVPFAIVLEIIISNNPPQVNATLRTIKLIADYFFVSFVKSPKDDSNRAQSGTGQTLCTYKPYRDNDAAFAGAVVFHSAHDGMMVSSVHQPRHHSITTGRLCWLVVGLWVGVTGQRHHRETGR